MSIGCRSNNPITSNNSEIDSLIFFKDSISRFSSLNSIDTVYRDTTINKLKLEYNLYTNDPFRDSTVVSGFFISGNPSVNYQTFGKDNNGDIQYLWHADSSVNYLHIGFGISFPDTPFYNIRMYNIKIHRIY